MLVTQFLSGVFLVSAKSKIHGKKKILQFLIFVGKKVSSSCLGVAETFYGFLNNIIYSRNNEEGDGREKYFKRWF